jgi:hypothetical protein
MEKLERRNRRKREGERGSATCVCVGEKIRLSSPCKPGADTWYGGIFFVFKALNFYKSLQDPTILKPYLLIINI